MGGTGRLFSAAVIAGCALSIAGARPARWLEQLPAPVLAPLDRLIAGWVPPVDGEALELLRGPAKAAWRAYCEEILGEVPVSGAGREGLLVPVVARDRERHELVLAVPAEGVRAGGAVTHRGVLLGFVRDTAREPGRATVTLLGREDARPVAAEWSASADGRSIQFLLQSAGSEEGYRVRVAALTSRVLPPPDQLAWTRDVTDLGDELPSGLLLGRLAGGLAEAPGGGQHFDEGGTLGLSPVLDPFALGTVTVEITPGAELPLRRGSAWLSPSCASDSAARLRAGARAGVKPGDRVCQAGLYVGSVRDVAPWTAVIDTRAPEGPLLVVAPTGEAVACRPERASWPPGWEPAAGDLVATGHVGTGGLVVGTIARVTEAGFELLRLAPDPRSRVTVVGP
jgi:hypothetical protein